jgi:hypothetical protein
MFVFDDGHLWGVEKEQRRQMKPALSMMERLWV